MPVVWGRMRVPANIIWVRGIREVVRTETETVGGGGKGGGGGGGTQAITRTSYHYYADVALGICEAPVTSIYRIWLDKTPLDPEHLDEIRTYYGDETQSPDPLIQAVEGTDRTPAFRGLAYVVLENLYLTPYGNRFPNFEIEVYRGSRADVADARPSRSQRLPDPGERRMGLRAQCCAQPGAQFQHQQQCRPESCRLRGLDRERQARSPECRVGEPRLCVVRHFGGRSDLLDPAGSRVRDLSRPIAGHDAIPLVGHGYRPSDHWRGRWMAARFLVYQPGWLARPLLRRHHQRRLRHSVDPASAQPWLQGDAVPVPDDGHPAA
jgi:hypothetical protein